MKILDFLLSVRCKALTFITILGALTALLVSSCEESTLEQIAVEKFTVSEIQIKTTDTLSLLIGKDSLLSIAVLPENVTNNKLIWTSSMPDIATVTQEGKVKALTLGTSIVSVASTDGSARKSSIVVKVIDHIDFISGITFTNTNPSLYESETLALTTTIAPANATYKTLKWTSSNTQVATVDSKGVVTGLVKGKATITAKATDGSGISQSVEVTVKEVIPITSLSFTTVLSGALAIGETRTLEVAVLPLAAADQPLLWSSSNSNIVSVTNGVIKGVGDGQAIITVASRVNPNVNATIEVNVEAGKINDLFNQTTTVWGVPTLNATGVISNGKFLVTMASGAKYRGDFKRAGGIILHAGRYPIIAFKFNRPLGTGNVIFDTNNGSYLNGNNKLTTITGKDGVQVHYADLSTGTFGGSAVKLSTTSATTLSIFQLKVADFVLTADQVAAGGNKYEVHWVKSFASLADLQTFINQ